MTKILAFGDNDVTSDAEEVNAAMLKEENVDLYAFLGDGPYSESGTKWTSMMDKSFGDKKDKLIFTRGNHDEDESESKQTQKDIEAWFPAAKGIGFEDTWLSSRQVGNVYVISMDTQDLDIEFKRDQYNWVAGELQKAKSLRQEGKIDWIVVLFHKPSFTLKSSHSPYTAMRFLYKDIFSDAQVDFALSGHNHNTQLWLPMVPNESEANGEGQQLFTLAADNKTFDFAKPHGICYIVNGISGHEFNSINDSGAGVKNVQFYRDDAFGYTSLEFNGKKAKVMSKLVNGTTDFEYNVTREGNGTGPDPEEPCPEGQHRDANGNCVDDPVNPDPTGIKCPRNYEFDPSLGHCIPLIEPDLNPDCGEGYTWNPNKKICEKDDGGPDPEPDKAVAKLELPTKAEPKQTDVIADASASTADTVEITETTSEGIQLVDTGEKWKKKFNIPDKNNFSIGIQAKAIKGSSQSVVQKSIQISTTGPNPDPTMEVDSDGIPWWNAKGKKVIVPQSRDEATDDRWSENVDGCEVGFEACFIGKSEGTNDSSHFACKQGGSNHSKGDWKNERWLDTGVRVNGDIQLQYEGPHPNNHDFELPDTKQFIKNIGKGLEGNWIGLHWGQIKLKGAQGSPANGGVRWIMRVNTDIAEDGTPDNSKWRLVYDFIDGVDVKVIQPQDYVMKGTMDAEVRRSDTNKHTVYKGGLHVRPLQ